MRRGMLAALFLLLLGTGPGCGSAGTTTSADAPARQGVGPHGGISVALGDQGFGEVVIESAPAGPVLAVYLLQPDQSSPLAAKPSSVAVEYDAGSGPASVSLLPKTGPSAGNRFEATLPSGLDDRFAGKLTVVIDGQTVEAELSPF